MIARAIAGIALLVDIVMVVGALVAAFQAVKSMFAVVLENIRKLGNDR